MLRFRPTRPYLQSEAARSVPIRKTELVIKNADSRIASKDSHAWWIAAVFLLPAPVSLFNAAR
jgi:hypothetical protein